MYDISIFVYYWILELELEPIPIYATNKCAELLRKNAMGTYIDIDILKYIHLWGTYKYHDTVQNKIIITRRPDDNLVDN